MWIYIFMETQILEKNIPNKSFCIQELFYTKHPNTKINAFIKSVQSTYNAYLFVHIYLL